MRRPPRRLAALWLAGALVLPACSSGSEEGSGGGSSAPAPDGEAATAQDGREVASLRVPRETTVLPGDAAGQALGASTAYFAAAPVALLVPADDGAAQARAARVAVGLQAPLLLLPPAPPAAAGGSPSASGSASGSASPAGSASPSGSGSASASASPSGSASASASPSGSASASGPGSAAAAGSASPSGSGSASPSLDPAAASATPDDVRAELDRLGTSTVLAFGAQAAELARGADVEVVTAPTDAEALREATGVDVAAAADPAAPSPSGSASASGTASASASGSASASASPSGSASAPASASGSASAAPSGSASPSGGPPAATEVPPGALATVAQAAPGEGEQPGEEALRTAGAEAAGPSTALSVAEGDSLAAAATARAAGAEVAVLPVPDPRVAPDALPQRAGTVVALGDAFGDAGTLDGLVATATSGEQLPGGGQLVGVGPDGGDKLYVALYGNPFSPVLGVLGEQGVDATVARAQRVAQSYRDAGYEGPVIPTFEIIATVASSSAGADGDYSAEQDPADLLPLVDAAQEAGYYVVLDLQPGRSPYLPQATRYEELLLRPHVGLAIDPEWRLGPDERHLQQIGSAPASEINDVVDYLARLSAENDLPQKMLVLHQFRIDMLPDREDVETTRPEVKVVIHMDGQGAQGTKDETYTAVTEVQPPEALWGWKNFYDEDRPSTRSPSATLQVDPPLSFISYQ